MAQKINTEEQVFCSPGTLLAPRSP